MNKIIRKRLQQLGWAFIQYTVQTEWWCEKWELETKKTKRTKKMKLNEERKNFEVKHVG